MKFCCIIIYLQWRIQEKGGAKVSSVKRKQLNLRKARKLWGYAHFRCIKLGKIPFSARGSPILDFVELLQTVN